MEGCTPPYPPTHLLRAGRGWGVSVIAVKGARKEFWVEQVPRTQSRESQVVPREGRQARWRGGGGPGCKPEVPQRNIRKIPEAWIQGRIQGTPASANEREKSTNASLSHPGTPPRTSLTAKPRTERGGGGGSPCLVCGLPQFSWRASPMDRGLRIFRGPCSGVLCARTH